MEGKVWSCANFCGHICRSSEVLFALCHQFLFALYQRADEMLFNFAKTREESGGRVEKPTGGNAARRFCSSVRRNDAVKPVEDKRACRIEVYQTTRVIECSSEHN